MEALRRLAPPPVRAAPLSRPSSLWPWSSRFWREEAPRGLGWRKGAGDLPRTGESVQIPPQVKPQDPSRLAGGGSHPSRSGESTKVCRRMFALLSTAHRRWNSTPIAGKERCVLKAGLLGRGAWTPGGGGWGLRISCVQLSLDHSEFSGVLRCSQVGGGPAGPQP